MKQHKNTGGLFFTFLALLFTLGVPPIQLVAADLNYQRDVKPILTKYCAGCHNETDHQGDVQLQNLASIAKGGPKGPILQSKNADESLLIRLVEGAQEPKMPPEDSVQPSREEIEVVRKWIEQGAQGTDQVPPLKARLSVKSIVSHVGGSSPITSIGRGGNGTLLVGRYNAVYGKASQWSQPLPIDIVGKVTQIRTTLDGRFSVISSGIPGVGGQATILRNGDKPSITISSAKVVRVIEAHNDTLYTAVLSPDGKLLATAGYDRVIMLWDVADGSLLRKLEGHNGAIYDLDFNADGQVLASASADETVKIWRVHDGERLDTFGQCEAEQYTVRFDSVRGRVLASGADKRVRIWKLLSIDKPSVSPMLFSTFAHEAPVSTMSLSDDGAFLATVGEDKQVKLWSSDELLPLGVVGEIEDAASGLIWDSSQQSITVSTLSGKLTNLDVRRWIVPALRHEKESSVVPPSTPMTATKEAASAMTPVEEPLGPRSPESPLRIPADVEVQGLLADQDMNRPESSGDLAGDWYLFPAKKNEAWVVKVDATGSPMDSSIDILQKDGKPILRTRLQAVRESYFTFRGKDSTNADDFRLHRWEDMELNEMLYAGGEVVKLWLYPRGPDSGFKVYPGFGKRFTYFDTTATTHALNEPAWIVRELAAQESPIPNGLPVFPVFYTNDDDSNRIDGVNSKLTFRPNQDGEYLVRVRDARGQSGDAYKYKLSIRRPNPRFQFRLETKEITLRPGSGTEFGIAVDRFDDFDTEIQVRLEGLPEGVAWASPLTIQAGQHKATGMLHCSSDAAAIPKEFSISVTCEGSIGLEARNGGPAQSLMVKVSEKPAMPLKLVSLEQDATAPALGELVIRPGQTISAKLVIERGENLGDISFGGDDSGRNLPHGCYVDNVGLSGLLIPAGQSTREVFITAAPWVPEQVRPFHLRANVDGNPTTTSILIRVVQDKL
jgi:WD40 repeat protein